MKCSIMFFVFMLLVPEALMGEVWEPSIKQCCFVNRGAVGCRALSFFFISVFIRSTSQLSSHVATFPVFCVSWLSLFTPTVCSLPVPPGGSSPMRDRPFGSCRLRPAPSVHLCVRYSRHTDRRRQESAGEPRRRRRPGQLQSGRARRHSADRPVCSWPRQRIQRRRPPRPAGVY